MGECNKVCVVDYLPPPRRLWCGHRRLLEVSNFILVLQETYDQARWIFKGSDLRKVNCHSVGRRKVGSHLHAVWRVLHREACFNGRDMGL